MRNIKKKLIDGFHIIAIIVCIVMLFICGKNVGDKMIAGKEKASILAEKAEEASWTQSRTFGKGEWLDNFDVNFEEVK